MLRCGRRGRVCRRSSGESPHLSEQRKKAREVGETRVGVMIVVDMEAEEGTEVEAVSEAVVSEAEGGGKLG